jgi:membrane protease YdiL (CAAX protease family)
VSTSNESTPLVESTVGAPEIEGQGQVASSASVAEINPNNPPWGLAAGLLTWAGSVVLLFGMSLLFIIPYIVLRSPGATQQELEAFLTTDKTAVLLQIVSAFPAHLLTLGIVWAVVTRFGKRPFWRTLGFTWSERVGFWTSAGLAVGLLAFGLLLTEIIKGEPTQIDQIIKSSTAARYTLAILAATTAPFVEEVVYRGVLYSALQKAAGMLWAIVGVSVLFTLVHVLQYYNNIGVIIVISLLSISLTLVRAFTGKLLPCFVMHLIFNGIQSVLIIVEPYLPQSVPDVEQKAPAFLMLANYVRHLF